MRSALERAWIPLTLLAGAVTLLSPMLLAEGTSVGATDDWRWFHLHWEASRAALVLHGELPGWNPYHCGGHVHWANPQTQFLSPAWWPTLLLGAARGLKVFTVVHLLAGALSMLWLARELGLTGVARGTAASVWILSGFFAWHVGGGHVAFQPFWYAPAALAALYRSRTDARWLGAVAGVLAWMVLEGGVYPVPFTVLVLALHAAWWATVERAGLRPLVSLGIAGGLAILLAGIKLGPMVAFLWDHPRVVPMSDHVDLGEVLSMFVSRAQGRSFGDHPFVRPEYASYVGIPTLGVLAGLLVTGGLRRHAVWWFGVAVFVALVMGDQGPLSPWALLHHAPVFRSLRAPSRVAVLVTMHVAVLAGFAVAHAQARLPGRLAQVLPALFLLGVTADLSTLGRQKFRRFRAPVAPHTQPTDRPFAMTDTAWRRAWALPARHEATTACYEPHPLKRGAVNAGLASEVYPAGGARGRVILDDWSPGRVEVQGELRSAGWVVLNQNDHAGWVLDGDGARASRRGLPAAKLGPGPFRTAFVYRTPGLAEGAAGSVLGAALLLLLLLRGRGRPA